MKISFNTLTALKQWRCCNQGYNRASFISAWIILRFGCRAAIWRCRAFHDLSVPLDDVFREL